MNLPFSSVKILKPDVPPKRSKVYMLLLNAWAQLRSLPAWQLLAPRHTVAKQRAAGERKVPWRPRP